MSREKILLTPQMASRLMERNYKNNRLPRKSMVNKIAQDIIDDRWDSEVSKFQDPILFTNDGTLINGQHRCLAVIKANRPIEIYAEYDVPESIYPMLDGGTARSACDFVEVPNRKSAAALAKIMCAVEDGTAPLTSALQGKISATTVATRAQVIEKINQENDRIQYFTHASQRMGSYLFNKRTQIATAAFLIEYTKRDDVLERFIQESSQMTTSSQQINVMRAYMGKCIAIKNFNADHKWTVSVILSTYEAFRNGTDINTFNKIGATFSKYDKYVFEARNRNNQESIGA